MKKIKYSYSDKKKYEEYQYKGLIGWLMKYDHQMLEKNLPKKKYSKVLEIGPGFHTHIDYVSHDYDNYYIIEKEKDKLIFHKNIYGMYMNLRQQSPNQQKGKYLLIQ